MVYGIDITDVFFRGIHAFMAAAWLLLDFIVFWLHFGVKDENRPLENRLERAHIMHGVDTVVAYIFLLMLPGGIILCYVTDTPVFNTTWLNWKHLLYGVIVVDALYLIPISGAALRNLNAIKAGAQNVDELNREIRATMNKGMPAVFLVWFLVAFVSVFSVFNLKTPDGQEYIFRKTTTEMELMKP